MCKRIFVIMLMLVVFGIMQADAQQLNYQAIARNANGVALTFRDVGIRLSIRDGSPNGSIVYSESRNIRTNQFGLFTVVIGSPGATNVLGSMASINWISGNKYLQVEIDPEGGTNYFQAGTSQLQAVPYALFANAAYPVGPAGGDLLGSTYPNPIIAPLAVTTGKIANQAITTPKIADLNVTTPKLADQAVTNAKIQDNTIANIKLVNSRVTLNGLILNLGDAQDFAIGTNGIDVNIVSAGNTHTFNFPDASIANRGLITPNAQTIGGNKTFNNDITAARIIRAGGLAAQFLKADGSVDNNIYLTENQPIIVTATGDAIGVSTSSRTAPVLPLTLATVNSAVGTYGTNIVVPSITVNNKGLVTNVVANPIPTATAITSGLLTVGDWNIFNNKQNAIPLGSAAQYFRGDLTLSNFQTDVRNQLSAGTNITYANGTFSNSAPMVYPGSGIALSNGNSWVGSITDNSNNWNTAFTDRFKWDGGASGLVPSTGRTSLGGTTVGSNFFTLTNPSAISFPRINADNSISTLSSADFRTAIGAGTVTSVNISVPTGLTVGGGPITSSGTINLGLATGYSIPTDANQANWTTAFNERLRWDGSASGLIPATGRTSLGGTTVGSNFFTLTNPSAISFPRMNADNTVTALSAADFRTAIGAGTSSTNGTVTSVDFTVPTGLAIAGGPITTSGTLALGLAPGYSIPTDANQANWTTAFNERLRWDGSASGLIPATGRTSLGGTTVGSNFFTLTNPSAISFPRMNADNTVTALSAADFRTAIGAGTSSTNGTVTSVDFTVPTGLTIGGGPITSAGTLALGLAPGYSIPTDAIQANWTTAFTQTRQWDGGATGLVQATGRTSLGGTTIGSNYFTLTNPNAISFPRMNADNTVTALSAADFRTAIGAGTSSTNGTVTSVDFTVPTGLTIGGGPITSAGTLALGLAPGYSIPTDAIQANWTTAFNERLRWDGSASGLIPATGRTSLGGTTVGSNFFTLTNPSAISFPRMNADNTVTALSAADFRTAIGAGTSSTNGTVTSVDFTVPTGLTIGGGPITSAGTLALGLAPGYSIPTDAIQANWTTAFTQTRQWDGGATGLVQATGRTSLGGTTIGSNYFTLTNPNAISFPRMNADNTVTALSAADFRTAIGVTGSSNAWSTEGNNGLSATTNFIGTTDAVALRFRVNNTFSGQIHPTSTVGNTSFGFETNSTTAANSYNSAFGSQALKANTNSGVRNSAFGALALTNNTSGEDNTGIGQGALVANLTGNNNTGVGQGALAFNSTGSSNTALGQAALNTNTTTSNNTAVGRSALFASTGSNNTGIGHFALLANTTGSANTAVGQNSLSANTTTSNNTALGWEALRNTTNSGNVGIGYNAGVNATFSNSISIGLNANVGSDNGIAIGAPATVGASSGNSIAIGLSAGTTAQQSIAIGSSTSSSGTGAISIGQNANASGINAVAIGKDATNTLDNTIQLGSSTLLKVITSGSINAPKFISKNGAALATYTASTVDFGSIILSGNDAAGIILIATNGSGTPPLTGANIRINFGVPYDTPPVVIIQAVDVSSPPSITSKFYCRPSLTTTTDFTISLNAALELSRSYEIAYHVIGK